MKNTEKEKEKERVTMINTKIKEEFDPLELSDQAKEDEAREQREDSEEIKNYTDTESARVFTKKFSNKFRFCPSYEGIGGKDKLSGWIVFNYERGVWLKDGKYFRVKFAGQLGKEYKRLADIDPRRAKDFEAFAKRAEQRMGIENMLACARPLMAIDFEELDQDTNPPLLNCPNGIVDLRTGSFITTTSEERRNHFLTMATKYPYNPKASAPYFAEFIQKIAKGDTDLEQFLFDLIGYFAIPGNPERKIFFLYGEGMNGKSTFLSIIRKVLDMYGSLVSPEALIKIGGARGGTYEVAQTIGKRLITCSELPKDALLDIDFLKRITGDQEIVARGIYSAPIRYQPKHKIVFDVNNKPRLNEVLEAERSRIVMIPFDEVFNNQNKIPQFDDVILKQYGEGEGILQLIVEGAKKYYENLSENGHTGLIIPESVRMTTGQYLDTANPLGTFIKEECYACDEGALPTEAEIERQLGVCPSPEAFVKIYKIPCDESSKLLEDYNEQADYKLSIQKFVNGLKSRKFIKIKAWSGYSYIFGLCRKNSEIGTLYKKIENGV